ncbi:MAG TPA: hypothetical protein VHN79_02190 [Lacunisphaera sp.]|nr:hypothetical protein [Lacunisphaera sp.]
MAQRAGACSSGVGITSIRQIARPLIGAVLALFSPLHAAPLPHPDRPDRLLESRHSFTVEFSPGQEAWMEMAFVELRAIAEKTPLPARPPAPIRRPGVAIPGSAQYLQENRQLLLATIARHVGLERPTELQGRVFDTFLGYYRQTAELVQNLAGELPSSLRARHVAIWERSDLIGRLRAGAKIEGMTYDPVTDRGDFSFNFQPTHSPLAERLRVIRAEIDAQQLRHEFNLNRDSFSASVTLGQAAETKKMPPLEPTQTEDAIDVINRLVVPIIYRADKATGPAPQDFSYLSHALDGARAKFEQEAGNYRHPHMVGVILHETAETGLVENIIASPNRRWLCDGTANYVMWRVARDLMGADFAHQVYSLDAKLLEHAAHQPKINLAAWAAAEKEQDGEVDRELNRAHYTFATRAMFLIAERHGEAALSQLWADVAKMPKKKVSAKTFADAYRKRFKADLDKLVREAQQKPIPVSSVPASPKV